jgi:hypothetical protein
MLLPISKKGQSAEVRFTTWSWMEGEIQTVEAPWLKTRG